MAAAGESASSEAPSSDDGPEPAIVPPEGEATAAAEAAPVQVPGEITGTVVYEPRTVRQELIEGGPCVEPKPQGEPAIDAARRRLFQTICGAALWFDGLFGEQRHVGAAERATGRLELSLTQSEFWGFKSRARFNVRVRFPNIDERLDAFVGRDDEDEFVRDRNEGFALRSQFRQFEDDDDRWVAGLGYGLPGTYEQRTDFRIGGKGGREPEIFAQGRLRRNWFLGDRTLWHLRETLFWTNRENFGITSAIDFDRVLASNLLLRWANVGTFSEETEGLDWRIAVIVYQNLERRGRAIAYETFVRGETDDVVPLREYGARTIFRKPLLGRDWLFGELYLGYSWPQEEPEEKRAGSYSVGFGVELLFGRDGS
ncbi:MAG TPA: hypothetical protein VI942_11065 [Thermoanaerobaculia bacterium]|nr:hypothetical protein [Thermoanaerobaculia bacterium]